MEKSSWFLAIAWTVTEDKDIAFAKPDAVLCQSMFLKLDRLVQAKRIKVRDQAHSAINRLADSINWASSPETWTALYKKRMWS